MATLEQRDQLLAVTCPWCGAGVKTDCTAGGGRPITTLDGGCHDARWRKAFDMRAPVVTDALPVRERAGLLERPERETRVREPVTVGAAIADRPW